MKRESTAGRKRKETLPAERPEIDKARALPFPDWARKFLKIRRLDGQLVPFELNPIQLRIDEEWERQLKERGHVRIIILKARKEGVSSYVQGKMVRSVLEREGWNAAVMAHEDSACDAIFQRTKTFAECLPTGLKRELVRNNKKELKYATPHNSCLRVNVAKSKGGFGRAWDIHEGHFSEVAFWNVIRGQSKASGQTNAIFNSVPLVPGTVVVLESTANGMGDDFHQMWVAASGNKSEFKALFFGWQDFPHYRLPGRRPEEFPADEEALHDEPRLREMGIDDEQLAWRRWKIGDASRGDIDSFRQEFPSYPEESFIASGRPVFALSLIQTRFTEISSREKNNPTRRFVLDSQGQPYEDRGGYLRFFRGREYGQGDLNLKDQDRFVIVADPSGHGTNAPDQLKGDPGCAYVWDRTKNEQIAELHGWFDPDEFALRLVQLGGLYSNPLLICESGPWGGHVVASLQRRGYPRLYFREQVQDGLLMTPTDYGRYGWMTTAQTKPLMIDALRQLWRDDAIKINALECCSEHLTFVKNGNKREAQSGCHDDRVICCAIYALWALQHPYEAPVERPVKKAETMGDIMEAMLKEQSRGAGGRFRLW